VLTATQQFAAGGEGLSARLGYHASDAAQHAPAASDLEEIVTVFVSFVAFCSWTHQAVD